jgi:hypothetical protein
MTTQKITIRFSVLAAMILLAAFSRIIPRIPNFSPLGAIGLFGAAHFQKKWLALVVPIAATWLSDLFINNVIYAQYFPKFTWFYSDFYWQYGSYLLIVFAALLIFEKINLKTMLAATITSTVIFFIVSNFAVWLGSNFYCQTFDGLITCYVAGIPFLKGTFLGDVVYCGVLFGGFALVQKQFPLLRLAHYYN